MRRTILPTLGAVICTLTLVAAASAKSSPAVHKATTQAKTDQTVWAPQTLEGKVIMTDPAQHLVVVQSQDGVPFDLKLTGSTQLRSGDQRVKAATLGTDIGKEATAHYRPEGSGDIATSIRIAE